MSATDLLARAARNNAWSSYRLHHACAQLDHAALHAPRVSFFPTLMATLNHVVVVDWYYVDALLRGGRGRAVFADPEPFTELIALATAQRAVDRQLIELVDALTDDTLGTMVELEREDHVQRERTDAVLMHLFTHQIHHRGQVHAMMAGTAVPLPPLDEFFLAGDLPLRQHELDALGRPA